MAQPIDRTFLNHYILFPKEAPTKSSQDNNLIASIFLGIFTFGIVHALCGLAYLCRKKPAPVTDPLTPTQAKTGAQFAKTSPATASLTLKAPAPAGPSSQDNELSIKGDGNCAFRAMAIGLTHEHGDQINRKIARISQEMHNRPGFNNSDPVFIEIKNKFLKASAELIGNPVNPKNSIPGNSIGEADQKSFDSLVYFLRCCTSMDLALKLQSNTLDDREKASFIAKEPSLTKNNEILTFLNNKCPLNSDESYYGEFIDAFIISRLFDTPMRWESPNNGTPQFTMERPCHILLDNRSGVHVNLNIV